MVAVGRCLTWLVLASLVFVQISESSAFVALPPKMIADPIVGQLSPVGKEIELDCSATGFPRPTIKWFKDGKPFTRRISGPVNPTRFEFVLRLKAVGQFDSGTYTCNVTNVYGWFSHSIKVDVMKWYGVNAKEQNRTKLAIVERIPNVITFVGESATFDCKVTSDSKFFFMWVGFHASSNRYDIVRNTTATRHEVVKETEPRNSNAIIPQSGSYTLKLTITKVTKADEAQYSCHVFNRVNRATNNGGGYLKVLDKPNKV